MKKLIAVMILLFAFAPSAVFAACPGGQHEVTNSTGASGSQITVTCVPDVSIAEVLHNVANILLGLAGGIALLFLIIGGFRYIVSAGNTDQIESARNTIYNALIGIGVIVVTFVILNTILNRIGSIK